MGKPYRVVLAEDYRILRDGLRAILAAEPDIEVVSEAADGLEAIRCVQACEPDLVVLDLSMPRMTGLDAIKEIKRMSPGTKVLVLTVHKAEEYVHEALRAGAEGYVLKDASSTELSFGLRSVLEGHHYLSPQVSTSVIKSYLDTAEGPALRSSLDLLTSREREVLKLIAEGHRNREIGELLHISEKTVERHRANVRRKLDLQTVQALTAYAIEKGLVTR